MKSKHANIELLAPAGNFEKPEIAIHYGADAVYLAGEEFSLRNFSGNFSLDEMQRPNGSGRYHNLRSGGALCPGYKCRMCPST